MLRRVDKRDLTELAEAIGWFRLTDREADEYATMSTAVLGTLDAVEAMGLDGAWGLDEDSAQAGAQVLRSAGRRPVAGEDPLNAIVRWTQVHRAEPSGPLTGLRIAVKDSVSVAGVPLTLGSSVIRGYVPTVDSVVAERLLSAGASIVATTNMDDFAFSGGGDTSAYGPIGNPFDQAHSTGGSSGGAGAALYYTRAIDAAIGCDQGGSIRLPSAWCGVLGLKPTHSLVPYTGIAGIDPTFDHAGPMARTATALGRVFAAIAGPHPSDPRQAGVRFDSAALDAVLRAQDSDLDGLRVGLVLEAFPTDDEPRSRTSAAVRAFADRLVEAGATVEEVHLPEHLSGGGIAFAGFVEGMYALLRGGANGYGLSGRYSPELALALGQGLRVRGDELPPQIKLVALLGEHLQRNYSGAVYAAAQNQRAWLRAAYDRPLADHDVLLMPTAPYPAYAHDPNLGIAERVLRGWEPLGNCAPTDMTGHPAISLPIATVNGLPVGAMLIGRRFDDTRLIDIALRYERRFGWDAAIVERQSATFGPESPPV